MVMSGVMALICNHLTAAVCLCETVAHENEPRLLCASVDGFSPKARFGVPVVGVMDGVVISVHDYERSLDSFEWNGRWNVSDRWWTKVKPTAALVVEKETWRSMN